MNIPVLQCDERAKARGWRPTANHLIERQIVYSLLTKLLTVFSTNHLKVYDGEETTDCGRDAVAAMEIIFNLDDSVVKVGNGHWVMLICGNGTDIISDYGVDPTMEQVVDSVEKEFMID